MRVKKILKFLAYSLAGFVGLILLLAVITQTQFFRDRLRSFVLSRLDSVLHAEVHLGTVTGNLVSGFSIDHLSIKVGRDYFVAAERLDLRYDLFEIPGKIISISELTLVRPQISLLRDQNGAWNFDRMIRPTPDDTSAPTPFDWMIQLKKLTISEATIVLVDSASLASPDHPAHDPYYVEYHNVILKHFTLETSLVFNKNAKHAVISSLRFESDQPTFSLKQLTGDFLVTKTSARVKGMTITTGASSIALDAEMKDFDLLGGVELAELQRKPIALSLQAHDIDLNELKRFLTPLEFLNGSVSLDLEAGGEFGEIDVKRLDLAVGETEFHVAGTLLNLHTPSALYLNAKFDRSVVYSPNVKALLPTFDLPDLQQLGHSKLNLTFVGTPLDFRTQLSLETDAGNVHTNGTLKIGGPDRLQYNGDAEFRALNLAKITHTEQFQSSLNGTVHIKGKGVSFHNLGTSAEVKLDSSELSDRHIKSTQLQLDASSGELAVAGSINVESLRATLSGVWNEREKSHPAFSLKGMVSSLNLQELLRDPAANSDLNFGITAHGNGTTLTSLNGDFLLDFLPSRYREYKIDSSNVHFVVDQQNPSDKRLTLTSNIADFSVSGTYNIDYMRDLIAYELINLRREIGKKFVALDSTLILNSDPAELASMEKRLSAQHENLNASFSLHIKDLEPLSVVTNNRRFDGVGVLTGTMRGDFQDLALNARLAVDDFFYGDADSGILVQNGITTLEVSTLKPHSPLKDIGIRLVVDAESAHLNRTQADSLHVTFNYAQEHSSYVAHCRYNKDALITIEGSSSIIDDYLTFTLNNLLLSYKDFAWKADAGASVGFGPRGIRVAYLTMHRDTQSFSLSGSIMKRESLAGTLTATHINLEDLKYVLGKGELDQKRDRFAGLANVQLTVGGTLQNPTYTASIGAERVSFRGVPLGNIKGSIRYQDRTLFTSIDMVNNNAAQPNLVVKGTIPMNLALTRGEETRPEGLMNLHVQSSGIQIGVLDPILPTFNQLNGIMKCDVTLGGSTNHPSYSGMMSIDSCSFLFVPNFISYAFDGRFEFRNDRIYIVNANVQSKTADDQFRRAGLMRLTGDFSLKDFKPSDFNLSANGKLLVVRETTIKSSLSVYGNLFIETGPQGLRYTGEIERSNLSGYVLVKNSSLIFPPTQQSVNEQFSNTVPTHVMDDTTRITTPRALSTAARYFGTENEQVQPGDRNVFEQEPSKSFVEGIRYNLEIECAGANTELKMIFNSATNEELVANLNGRFSVTEDGTRWVGTLSIDRAYYRFIKQFNADGTIKYSGDFLSPELDISATYEGFRTTMDSTSSSRPEKIVVTMHITGTRVTPKLEWSMTIDDVDYYSYSGITSSDVQTDALSFILAGTFPLSKSQANDLAVDLGPTARSSLVTGASSLVTSAFSDFLRRETGFIYSFELNYGTQSTFGEAADIRLSGVAAGGIWRYGGKILNDPFSNANVSLLYSLGDILERPSLRNFMFELERRVETNTIGEQTDRKQTNSARLFYRFSF